MSKQLNEIRRIKIAEDRLIASYNKKYAPIVYKAINEQIKGYNKTFVIDPMPMHNALKEIYVGTFLSSATLQYRALKSFETKALGFFKGLWSAFINTWAEKNLATKVQEIDDTTQKHIAEIVAKGVDEGLRPEDISKNITEKFVSEIGKSRALMIAKTESGNASNMGKVKAAEDWSNESGVDTMKMWIHRPVKKARDWHAALDDNKAYPMDFQWSVTDPRTQITDLMDRPHDNNASAGNVINCQCTILVVSKRYGERLNRQS